MRRDIHLLLAMLYLLIHFADFFTAQVEKIHIAPVARNRDLSLADDNELFTNAAELNNFHEVSQEDVKQFAYKPLSKPCCLDPLPASLLRAYL